ncbi:MAG: SpoIIIAH-like family protein, partial [Clostridia bacterium]
KETWKKIKGYNYKKMFTSRNFIITGCVMLIAVGVIVTSVISSQNNPNDVAAGNESGPKVLGNPVLVGSEKSEAEVLNPDTDSYFAMSVINRKRVRDEAMEVLRQVADNPDVMPDAKEKALKSISLMVKDMNSETTIETLIKSKGFEECVTVISGDLCSVIVKTDGLLADEVAQILEVVLQNSSIKAKNVKVVPKN